MGIGKNGPEKNGASANLVKNGTVFGPTCSLSSFTFLSMFRSAVLIFSLLVLAKGLRNRWDALIFIYGPGMNTFRGWELGVLHASPCRISLHHRQIRMDWMDGEMGGWTDRWMIKNFILVNRQAIID